MIIETTLWITPLINVQTMNIHQKMVIFNTKTIKANFKEVILSLKIYKNILKFNFLMGGIRHIDCFGKYFEAVIYRCKRYTNLWPHYNTFELTLISVNSLDTKQWICGYIHAILVVLWPLVFLSNRLLFIYITGFRFYHPF